MLLISTVKFEKKSKDNESLERWLRNLPNSMLYYTPCFYQFLAQVTESSIYLIIAKENDAIVGILPYAVRDFEGVGKIVNSLPWYGTHGGVMTSGNNNEVRNSLIAAYVDTINDLMPLSSTLILRHEEYAWLEEYKTIISPDAIDLRIGQVTPLPLFSENLEQDLFATVRQKTRNLIRKSLRQGFEEISGDNEQGWRFLWKTHHDNMEAIGANAKPWSHFEALQQNISIENRRLTLATLNDVPVAAMLCLHFNQTVEYVTPVVKVEYRNSQPLSFLIWNGMNYFVRQGYKRWNWGGTGVNMKTLHHFKAGWGGEDEPYAYLTKLTSAGESLLENEGENVIGMFPYWYFYPLQLLNKV